MNYYIVLAGALFGYMSLWFFISLFRRRNDVADVAWGGGFVLLAWLAFLLIGNFSTRSILVNILVSIWGLRLAWHIYYRNKGKGEDYRYAAWRKDWGKWFYIRSYFQVYLLQGAFLLLIITPVLFVNKDVARQISFVDILGIMIWSVGFYFEAVGDWQLVRFLQNPANKGKIMQSGLWFYTRHPNYFGELTQWWALWIIALSSPYGWVGIVGPITITFLILKVSGVPLLEAKMADNPEFIKYKRRTSILFPFFPKK